MKRKLGPFPVWAWIVLAAALFWFVIRPRLSGSSSTATAAPTGASAPSDTSSGASGNTGSGISTDSGGSGGPVGATDSQGSTVTPAPDYTSSLDQLNQGVAYLGQGQDALTSALLSSGGDGGYSNPAPNQISTGGAATTQKHTVAAPAFGGVVSTKKLKNGAILTTYKSGRQIEQAPGKSAYVVHK